ncbi:hypothetical protein WAI453_011449 [Rhynchosporium graminicola]
MDDLCFPRTITTDSSISSRPSSLRRFLAKSNGSALTSSAPARLTPGSKWKKQPWRFDNMLQDFVSENILPQSLVD